MKTTLLIFGITGDLSRRKLLPALREIVRTGQFDDLEIVGVSRREVDVREILSSSLGDDSLEGRVAIETMDLDQLEGYERLAEKYSPNEEAQLLVYMSVPPDTVVGIVDRLGEVGLNTPRVKLLFEKPFGTNLLTASETIARTNHRFSEDQVYRIDHFLAKEMAQNIVALRGGNALLSNIWSNQFIERIEVVAYETLGIEGRGVFYEQTGALRDVVQGHLMQLLSLALMDIPHQFDWSELPAYRLHALRHLYSLDPRLAIRAQYDSYRDEVGSHDSTVETFVSMELASRDPRWEGVRLQVVTGKCLDRKGTEIRVHLRKQHDAQSNCIVFRIQPHEGVEIELFVKKPGYASEFETRMLRFNYPEDEILPDAYEHVLIDAMRSRKSLFASSDEVLHAWQIIEPVQSLWLTAESPLRFYPKGSSPDSIMADARH